MRDVTHELVLTIDINGVPRAALCSCGWTWERKLYDPGGADLAVLAVRHLKVDATVRWVDDLRRSD